MIEEPKTEQIEDLSFSSQTGPDEEFDRHDSSFSEYELDCEKYDNFDWGEGRRDDEFKDDDIIGLIIFFAYLCMWGSFCCCCCIGCCGGLYGLKYAHDK